MTSDSMLKISKRALDPDELAEMIRLAIKAGHSVCFNAPGGSMLPFIHSDDKICVSPVEETSIRVGDILIFVRPPDNQVIAHRVVKCSPDGFLCKGDNVTSLNDGWMSYGSILGRVDRVQRDGKDVRMGVKLGNRLIAWLSEKKLLVPLFNSFRRVKRGIIRLFSWKSEK